MRYKNTAENARDMLTGGEDGDRFVDFGVELRVVEKDYKNGIVPPGTVLPPLVATGETMRCGGSYDTLRGCFVGDCEHWHVWLVGPKQFEILKESTTRNMLLLSAEGAGKTTLMAMWAWLRIIDAMEKGVPGALGATAPTATRLETFITAICDLAPISSSRRSIPSAWGMLRLDAQDIRTIGGHLIQFRSTKQQSAATGSPLQGYNFGLGIAMDELQDSIHAYYDAVARLRAGKDAPICATATAKISPSWKTFRDSLSDNWTIHRISGPKDAQFVHNSHWEMMQKELSEREWDRRGLAKDVGPERMVYTAYDRANNIVPIPLGAKDVTPIVLAKYGRAFGMLIGHDPGTLQDATLMLKAYRLRGQSEHVWFVVDEFRTKETTSAEHALQLRDYLQSTWNLQSGDPNEPSVLLRCDPYGTTDYKTDKSVYNTFRRLGFDIRSAAYKKGKGNGVVPKEAGISLINSLLRNAKGTSRLFVARTQQGTPVAPLLTEALELSERDGDGRAETQKKRNKGPQGDLSDFPAALRYALWGVENGRLGAS